jgi:hypothetical protein
MCGFLLGLQTGSGPALAPAAILLDTATWHELLNTEQGPHIKQVLDGFMPKSQVIIARKPL